MILWSAFLAFVIIIIGQKCLEPSACREFQAGRDRSMVDSSNGRFPLVDVFGWQVVAAKYFTRPP
jgi:hypothetical protein